MNSTTLLISVFAGCFGLAYFVYGKRQAKVIPLLSGICLCVIPYFIENTTINIFVFLALIIAPFVIKI
jgi:Na+/H+-dicarboxylate symporter